jgi:hypothetical protein
LRKPVQEFHKNQIQKLRNELRSIFLFLISYFNPPPHLPKHPP